MKSPSALALTLFAPFLALGACATVASAQDVPTGAPKQADVTFESRLTDIPPEAVALQCLTIPDCTTSGDLDLATEADVSVTYDPATGKTRGADSLSYTLADGNPKRTVGCRDGGPYVASLTVDDTIDGNLFVSDVRAVPDANTLGVSLDPAGEFGSAFPLEVGARTDGGCGVEPERNLLNQSLWYGTFHFGHQDEWDPDTGGLKIDGLSWDSGSEAFIKTYDRPLNIGAGGPAPYTAQENTRIEVKPEFCPGTLNQVASATANGQSLALDGMKFYAGQVLSFPPGAAVRLSDGSVLELDKGGSWKVDQCFEAGARYELLRSVNKVWVEIKKTLNGSKRKFEVKTDRAVAGVRGTKFALSYDKAKQLTRVAVKEGTVSLKGINGAKGKILIDAGEVGVQKGKKAPEFVKR